MTDEGDRERPPSSMAALRRFAGPGILYLIERGLDVSGMQDARVAAILWLAALIWGLAAIVSWDPVRRRFSKQPIWRKIAICVVVVVTAGLSFSFWWGLWRRVPNVAQPAIRQSIARPETFVAAESDTAAILDVEGEPPRNEKTVKMESQLEHEEQALAADALRSRGMRRGYTFDPETGQFARLPYDGPKAFPFISSGTIICEAPDALEDLSDRFRAKVPDFRKSADGSIEVRHYSGYASVVYLEVIADVHPLSAEIKFDRSVDMTRDAPHKALALPWARLRRQGQIIQAVLLAYTCETVPPGFGEIRFWGLPSTTWTTRWPVDPLSKEYMNTVRIAKFSVVLMSKGREVFESRYALRISASARRVWSPTP